MAEETGAPWPRPPCLICGEEIDCVERAAFLLAPGDDDFDVVHATVCSADLERRSQGRIRSTRDRMRAGVFLQLARGRGHGRSRTDG